MSETPKRTIIVQPKKAELVLNQTGHHDAEHLMQDALGILSNEIVNLRQAQKSQPKGLDLSQARVLTGYIKSITDILKEQREREADPDELANMSDEEIEALLQGMRKSREAKGVK